MNIILLDMENAPSISEGLSQKFAAEANKYTYPVLVKYNESAFSLFGTCVAIAISGKKFICTASHLINEISKANAEIVIPIQGKFHSVNSVDAQHLSEDGTDYDVCLLEIKEEIAGISYIDRFNTFKGDKFHGSSRQYLQGFPIAKNKKWDIHNHKNKTIQTGYLGVVLKVDQTLTIPFDMIYPESHFIFELDAGAYKKGGNDFVLSKRQSMPGLVGLSGCGLWNCYDILIPSTLFFAGIFINHKKGVGAATKAKHIERLCK